MPANELLLDVIESATIDRLRSTLRNICSKSDVGCALVCDELLIPANSKNIGLDEHRNSNANGQSTKRKLDEYLGPRFAICEQCEKEFDILAEAGPEECRWHEGI